MESSEEEIPRPQQRTKADSPFVPPRPSKADSPAVPPRGKGLLSPSVPPRPSKADTLTVPPRTAADSPSAPPRSSPRKPSLKVGPETTAIPKPLMPEEDETLNLSDLEVLAKTGAMKQICTMLQRPDQLEKIDQYKKRILRKKGITDAALKETLQSQLDCVSEGLVTLKRTVQVLQNLNDDVEDAKESYLGLTPKEGVYELLRDESLEHKKLQMTKDNLEHVFSIPHRLRRCGDCIEAGKLLSAHKYLMDLENSRDELFYEFYLQTNQSKTDDFTLRNYFKDVSSVNAKLEKKLFDIFKRRINSVILEPKELVTVLRIIEREEQIDSYWENTFMKSGFRPDSRPKDLRRKAFATMESQCKSYIEVFLSQPDQNTVDKAWLIHQLELAKSQIMGDLRVARSILPSCCPPSYDIFNKFLSWYHKALSQNLRQMIKRDLKSTELIPLLSWVKTYKTEEMLLHPDLQMEATDCEDLLSPEEEKDLISKYESQTAKNMKEWMTNCLQSDKEDWMTEKKPEADGSGHYFTPLPMIIHEMIEEHLKLAKTISTDLVLCTLRFSFEQLGEFLDSYQEAIKVYKQKHFITREKFCPYTIYTTAFINNLSSISQYVDIAMQRYCGDVEKEDWASIEKQTNSLKTKLKRLTSETILDLLDEMFLDLDSLFAKILTKNWMESNEAIDTICVTIEDYNQDYIRLKPELHRNLCWVSVNRVVSSYIRRLLSRSVTFTDYEERILVSEKIVKENQQIQFLYTKIGLEIPSDSESPLDVASFVSEILRLRDASMISLEFATMINKFPDLTKEHLMGLCYLRSDTKNMASEIIAETLGDEDEQNSKKLSKKTSLFSLIKM